LASRDLQSLSSALGILLPQSPRQEFIEDIRDYSDIDEKDERGYRSAGPLSIHSDPPTLIALHCLQPAKQGGDSYLVNVKALHDAIEHSHPELLSVLYRGFPHWNVEGQKEGPGPAKEKRPIFINTNGKISCVHYRPFVEKAAAALNEPLSQKQIAALDIFDDYANANHLALRFTDWPEPDKRRHLLRTWIDAPKLLPVHPQHELGNLFA